MSEYSPANLIALSVLMSVGATLSIVGSALIIYMELSARRKHDGNSRNKRPTFHRFLLAMSVYKILQAIWGAPGPMAVPKWTGGYGCFGNTGTCTAQGVFATLSLAELIYNAGLSIYYILTIRYGCREQWIARRYEPVIHSLAFIEPMIFIVSGLSMNVYNPSFILELGCWASPYPIYCIFSPETCERGRYYSQWSWAFYSQQCLYVAIVVIMSALLYWTIRSQYASSNRYASRESMQMRERTRDVANQALLFAAAAIYANMWSIITTLDFYFGAAPLWTKISVINGVPAFTGQGFLNFLVYIRPRYVRLRRSKPELGRWGTLVQVVLGDPKNNRRPMGSFSDGTRWSKMFRRRSSTESITKKATSIAASLASGEIGDGLATQSVEAVNVPHQTCENPEQIDPFTQTPADAESLHVETTKEDSRTT